MEVIPDSTSKTIDTCHHTEAAAQVCQAGYMDEICFQNACCSRLWLPWHTLHTVQSVFQLKEGDLAGIGNLTPTVPASLSMI